MACKAGDEIRKHDLLQILPSKKKNDVVVTSIKLINNFAGLITITGLRPNVARGPSVGVR